MAVIAKFIFLVLLSHVFFAEGQSNPNNIPVMGPISLWRLPQDGSPMYYRHFRDRISWYEADAVCQFHHGNLVTVDSSTQYDALRAFLRHEDILSNVWIGLVRSHKNGAFTWSGTYQTLSGDGYWAEALPRTSAPLCATADPARDYRWHARHCGGAEVASFVCELKVPDWTKECTVPSMNGIQYAYLPEEVAVQLEVKCPLDEGGLRKVRCQGRQDRKTMEKELACIPEAGDVLDNMIPQSSGLGKTTKAPTVAKTWRYTSVSSLEEGPQTRHRRDAEVATSSETNEFWSSTMRSTSVDEEIEALEETARRDGVLIEDSDVDMMMADERTIENFVVDSTPTSEATDTEIDVIETVKGMSESITPNAVSTEAPEDDEQHIVSTSESQPVTHLNTETHTDQLGIKPPMVHARSDFKSIYTSESTELHDHTADMKLLGHLPKNQIVLNGNKSPQTTPVDDSDNANVSSINNNVTVNEDSTPTLQNILPIDTDIVLLKESSYSIIKNGTVIDVLELNDTISEDEKTTTDNTVNAPIINDKEIEDNMILQDEEKPVKVQKQEKRKISEHKVVELTFTEPSVFSSSFVITTKVKEESTETPMNSQTQEIDPKIEQLNSNTSKVNTDSELLFENKSVSESFTTSDLTKDTTTFTSNTNDPPKIETSSSVPAEPVKESIELQEADIEPSEEIEPEPEPLHRPNRRRLLTKPEPRGGYPFYIRRVLG